MKRSTSQGQAMRSIFGRSRVIQRDVGPAGNSVRNMSEMERGRSSMAQPSSQARYGQNLDAGASLKAGGLRSPTRGTLLLKTRVGKAAFVSLSSRQYKRGP